MNTKSLSQVASELRAQQNLDCVLRLRISEVSLRLRSNSPELVATLSSYFGNLVQETSESEPADIEICAIEAPPAEFECTFKDWPRDGGKVGRKEAYADYVDGRIVQKIRTGMHFLVGDTDLLAIGPCLANDNQITNFINSQYVSRRLHEGWQLCHAAGVVAGKKGLCIAAKAGAGKSTLALHLMSSGLSFLSNDRVLIQGGGEGAQMAGIPKMPRVNPGTLLHNPDLSGILPDSRMRELRTVDLQELWNLEEKYDVMIEQTYGPGRTVSVAALNTLLILNWSAFSTEPTRFESVNLAERPDLLELVMKSPGVFHQEANGHVALADRVLDPGPYLEHLRAVPVVEATGRADFEKGVEFCGQLLTGD